MEKIKVLSTDEELFEVGKFRYKVYIEEMKRTQKYADHKKRTIIEPEDKLPSTKILAAYINEELVGTSRIHIYRPQDDVSNLSEYSIPKEITDNFTVTEGTKYMIKPSLRGENNTLGTSMMKFAYQLLIDEGVDIDFLNANDYLVHYYNGKGYRSYGKVYFHKELGQFVYPMALIVKDYEYLKLIKSPFAEDKSKSLLMVDKKVDEVKRILLQNIS